MSPHEYSAQLRQRVKPCECAACKQAELLPAVQRILDSAWAKSLNSQARRHPMANVINLRSQANLI